MPRSVGLFTIVGAERALLYDLPYVSAIFIGVAAAVGGGLLVDLIAGRPVEVVHRGDQDPPETTAEGKPQ
jgi:uncharacterized membrane protein YeiH